MEGTDWKYGVCFFHRAQSIEPGKLPFAALAEEYRGRPDTAMNRCGVGVDELERFLFPIKSERWPVRER
jgi:hypothetical protein